MDISMHTVNYAYAILALTTLISGVIAILMANIEHSIKFLTSGTVLIVLAIVFTLLFFNSTSTAINEIQNTAQTQYGVVLSNADVGSILRRSETAGKMTAFISLPDVEHEVVVHGIWLIEDDMLEFFVQRGDELVPLEQVRSGG
jgi:hypothetical protein